MIPPPPDRPETAAAIRTASWSRSAASSWESPVRCAAATKSSAQAHAASASNAAPARAVAENEGPCVWTGYAGRRGGGGLMNFTPWTKARDLRVWADTLQDREKLPALI